MLVLSRFIDEKIVIGEDIVITVLKLMPSGKVRLGIEAPAGVSVDRLEVRQAKQDVPREPGKGGDRA